jgi:hypothetical protein
VLFNDKTFIGSTDTLSFDLEEKALDCSEIGIELEVEMIERLEVCGVNFLEELVKKG